VLGKVPLYHWHSSQGPAIRSKSLLHELCFLLAEAMQEKTKVGVVACCIGCQTAALAHALQVRQAGLDLTCNESAMGTWH